ncbi:hypothetical protein FRC11_009063, partial [Ceratobasidium sp. 423]
LGELVPLRFTGDAKEWWYANDSSWHQPKTRNWDTLKDAILTQFMSRNWMDKQYDRAQARAYRDINHPLETPSQYIRDKKKLLQRSHEYQSVRQLIYAILLKAPEDWQRIIDTSVLDGWEDFERKIEYHEKVLMNPAGRKDKGLERRLDKIEHINASTHLAKPAKKKPARTHLMGSRDNMPSFKTKPLDHVISKGKTPAMAGARPCIYCKSGNHWDNDCPLNKKKKFRHKVKANLATLDEADSIAQAEYDHLQEHHDSDSSCDESRGKSEDEKSSSDFF